MEFFKSKTNINFMALRKWTALVSLILFIASITILWTRDLNWGLDFTGGTQLQISYQHAANLPQIRDSLSKVGLDKAIVQSFGTAKDVLISLPPAKNLSSENLKTQILTALPGATIERQDTVGPEIGSELASKGALAFVVAMIAIMIYITIRFEWRFSISAVIALIHDPALILGVFSFYHIEFDLTTLAAILAVIGYSLNDTIVIYDRVRENFRKIRKSSPLEIMNLSINQTLSRTVMTSAATLTVVLMLFLFGGAMIHNFALVLILGIIVGTYSSIYVAGALAVALGLSRKDLMPKEKAPVDDLP